MEELALKLNRPNARTRVHSIILPQPHCPGHVRVPYMYIIKKKNNQIHVHNRTYATGNHS